MKDVKLDKQTQYSINYFKKTDTLKLVGGGVLIAGLFALWIGWGLIGFILAFLGVPVGFVLFFIGSTGRVNDEHMETYINNKMAGLVIDIDTNRSYQLRLLKNSKDITVEGYHFHDEVMIKKLKDGSLRSSEFSRTKIRTLKDALYIVNRKISLIYDENVQNNLYEIPYDSILSIEAIREQKKMEFNKNIYNVKHCTLVINCKDQILKLPCADALTSEELVSDIERKIKQWRESEQNSQTK